MADQDKPDEKPSVEDVALSDELDKLGAKPAETKPDAVPADKPARKSRSGTSGAERARRAKAASDTKPAPTRARTSRAKAPDIAGGMAQLYAMAGLAVGMVPSGPAQAGPYAGAATVTGAVGLELVANSKSIGAAWEKAAKDDPRIREALEKLLTVSTIGAIVTAHMPVVLGGLVAAGLAPAALVGQAEPAPQQAAA